MIKKILLGSIFIQIFLLTQPVNAEGPKMFQHKPKHVIFLIHGIGGNKTHFGYMSKALSKILKKKDPNTRYIVKSIEYDTGNHDKTPYEFAQDVNVVIQKTTASGRFKPEDKISLIMHSQGGLIGSIWMFQSLMGNPGFGSPETIKHLDSFITLGTPFWGAKTAKWGSEIRSLTDKLGVDVPLKFGRKELEEMSFGSDMIYDFRMAMIDPKYKPYIDHVRTHVKLLNIVGVADVLNPLGIFVSGTEKYEDDGAVPLASARFNFLYNRSIDTDYEDGQRLSVDNMNKIELAPYVVVNAMHRSPLPELENFAGLPQIPKDCVKREDCWHPAFPYLWKQILGEEITQIDEKLGGFRSFLVDLNVRVDASADYNCENVNVELTQLDGTPLKNSHIEVAKFFEFYSEGKRTSQKYTNHCRFYYTGSLKKSKEQRQDAILIKVSGKNLKTRLIEMPLKASYSSFVDVTIKQKNVQEG